MNGKALPLEGIKVVELGTHVAIPVASRMMASWGAEVIKVENPIGDEWRRQGKVFRTVNTLEENPCFMAYNTNKKLISLNIKEAEARQILLDLIKDADVFLTSVRMGPLKKLGLDYDEIKKVNPKIIYCFSTSYGARGEDASKAGLDTAVFWGRSGCSVDWVPPGAFPLKPFPGTGDATMGSMILNAVLTALIARDRTGEGTLITSSLYGCGVWYNAMGVISAQEAYGDPYPKSEFESVTPFAHIYKCKDGEWIFLCVIQYEVMKEKLFRIFDMNEYLDDPRFKDITTVHAHMKELIEIVNERFLRKTSDEWCAIFKAEDCIHQKLLHARDVVKDQQAWDNGYLEEFTFANGHKSIMPNIPIEFSNYSAKEYVMPGDVGCDTDEILSSKLGISPETIADLRARKAIK